MRSTIIFLLAMLIHLVGISKDKNPNIIFILADDLGYGDVSCYNEDSKIYTPNIDKLAAGGVMFTNAHTSSAVCTPTRYGIVTGRYSWRTRLKKGVLGGYSKSLIEKERLTVAGFLQEEGYTTGYSGKWHLGWDWSFPGEIPFDLDSWKDLKGVDFSKPVENGPLTHGFDYSFGFCGSLDMPPYVYIENDVPTMVPTKTTVGYDGKGFWRKGLTSDDFDHTKVLQKVTDKAIDFINREAGKENPFFLYLPLPAPHTPILPTSEFMGKSNTNFYGDFVMQVDDIVKQVVNALEQNNVKENTLLIFSSDNGCSPMADFDELKKAGHSPSYIFRGHKADIFEGGHRVPYIVSWPEKIKKDCSTQLVCTTDLFATVADLFKAKLPEDVAEDSYSFLPSLHLESKAEVRKDIIHHSQNGSFAITKGDWKVVFCPGSGGWSNPTPGSEGIEKLPQVQLYNLKDDVSEKNNLQAKFPEIVKEYKELLLKYVEEGRSTKGTPQKNDGPESWEQFDLLKKCNIQAVNSGDDKQNWEFDAISSSVRNNFYEQKVSSQLITDPLYYTWGNTVIKWRDGKYHAYYARWKKEYGFVGWITDCEIAHAISDKPEGPFIFVNVAVENKNLNGWDIINAHNPSACIAEGKICLYYISDDLKGEHGENDFPKKGWLLSNYGKVRNSQRIGVAIADNPSGPFKRSEKPVVEPHGVFKNVAVNPAVIYEDGKYVMIMKGDDAQKDGPFRIQLVGHSDQPEGPFIFREEPVYDKVQTEDACIWYDKVDSLYYMVCHVMDTRKLALFQSKDSYKWMPADNQLFMKKEFVLDNGEVWKPERVERPFVLTDELGQPLTLYIAVKDRGISGNIAIPIRLNN